MTSTNRFPIVRKSSISLAGNLRIPVLDALVPGGLSYGTAHLVEFEPQSLWYDTSLTICAQALKRGAKTEYHSLMHLPGDIRQRVADQGVDVEKVEDEGIFRINDAYTPSAGIEIPEGSRKSHHGSVNIATWDRTQKGHIERPPDEEKGWVHIDDDLSAMLQYNDENEFHKTMRDTNIPWARSLGLIIFQPVAIGLHPDSFYRRMESVCDGIMEFRALDEGGRVENYARVRMIRGKALDSSWKLLKIRENGEVGIDTSQKPSSTLGIKRWIKGPQK